MRTQSGKTLVQAPPAMGSPAVRAGIIGLVPVSIPVP